MADPTTVAVLHPGQMGTVIAREARRGGADVVWLPAGRGAATRHRADDAGLRPVDGRESLAAQSDVVLSICPPHAAESVAETMAAAGFAGIYVDANPISPQRDRGIATTLAAHGATVVDGGIIGPAESGPGALRLYLAGDAAAVSAVARLFEGGELTATPVAGGVGAASALKLAYSLSQKAGRALAALSYALADRHSVADELRAAAASMKNNPLSDPDYLAVAASRGWRWAAEMDEVSDSLTAAGLPGRLPRAAGEVFARWTELKDSDRPDLSSVLDALSSKEHKNVVG